LGDGGADLVVAAGSRSNDHLGSGRNEAAYAALQAAVAKRLAAGQGEPGLGLAELSGAEPLSIVSSRAAHLRNGLYRAYELFGFDNPVGGDEDELRVIAETGMVCVWHAELNRRLPVLAKPTFRKEPTRHQRRPS
jgi:hypothetical protein